jgi:NADPH2:quinone reductase
LVLGDLPDPVPGQGEVLVALRATGVNPSDVKLRAGARAGAVMGFPRIVPHSDGAGVIAAVGAGVDEARVGERVWVWNAGWQRAFGTAAEFVALPAEQAVRLPDGTSFAEGACFGIPAMTAWYAVMGDGPVAGQTVLVTGGAGTVGRYAVQMARMGGVRVIATVSSDAKAAHSTAEEWINYRETDVAGAVMDLTQGAGVDRIIDVDFGANQAVDLALVKPGGVIAAYASAAEMVPRLEFYPFMFKNVRLHMLIVYQLAGARRRAGERQLTDWLEAGALSHAVVPGGGLADCASAHDLVARGDKLGTVVLDI